MNYVIFNIDTGPLPIDQLAKLEPEFKPKAGLKDPEKIKADVAEKRDEWYASAALSPITGQVLCLGIKHSVAFDGSYQLEHGDEVAVIERFFQLFRESLDGSNYSLVGFNILEFDLPFLIRRAWKHNLQIPSGLFYMKGRYANWSQAFIDIRQQWQFGNSQARGTLDQIDVFMGGGGKTGIGADFARLFENTATRHLAFDYEKSNLDACERIARRMGVIK